MKDYGAAIATRETSNIFYSMEGLRRLDIVVGKNTAVRAVGCMLGKKTADGKYYPYKVGASDGTELLAGILGVETDATADDEKAFMYVSGEFNKTYLTADDEASVVVGEYKSGNILIKEGM